MVVKALLIALILAVVIAGIFAWFFPRLGKKPSREEIEEKIFDDKETKR